MASMPSSKPLVLLYGPDEHLKKIKAKFVEENPGFDVQLRTTDRYLGFVETQPCDKRVICHSGASEAIREEFVKHGMDVIMAYIEPDWSLRYGDVERTPTEKLDADAPGGARAKGALNSRNAFALDNGRLVGRDQALGRAAQNLGVSGDFLSSLEAGALADAVHAAYDITRDVSRQNQPFLEIEDDAPEPPSKKQTTSTKRPKAKAKA
jgi:hypothetical protein